MGRVGDGKLFYNSVYETVLQCAISYLWCVETERVFGFWSIVDSGFQIMNA